MSNTIESWAKMMAHPNENSNASIYLDSTPVRQHRLVGILDAEKPALDNFQTIAHFIKEMPVGDKTEMLLTLSAYCKAELNG
jgi:hypothetical protein